jgi:hypothetical protein
VLTLLVIWVLFLLVVWVLSLLDMDGLGPVSTVLTLLVVWVCCCAGMLRHQTALLDCTHRPPAAQQHYLNQFLETVKAQGIKGVKHFALFSCCMRPLHEVQRCCRP